MNSKDKKDFNRIVKNAEYDDLQEMIKSVQGRIAHVSGLRVCTRKDVGT